MVCGLQQLCGYEVDFKKSIGVYPVASSRFPGAAERAQQSRDVRNSGPGLGYGTAWLGVLRRFSTQALDQLTLEAFWLKIHD